MELPVATAIGSMPGHDAETAAMEVLALLPELPAWPQLPNRSPREGMIAQAVAMLPGVAYEGNRFTLKEPGRFIASAQAPDLHGAMAEDEAAGLHAFLRMAPERRPLAVKGHIIGPITAAISMEMYELPLIGALAFHLGAKAAWQEQQLRKVSPHTVFLLDEPALGTRVFTRLVLQDAVSKERAAEMIGITLAGVRGLKGVHVCSWPDIPYLATLPVDILSFDSYLFSLSLARYGAREIREHIQRGGIIAWGAVPTDGDIIATASAEALFGKREPLARSLELDMGEIARHSLFTPSCGLAGLRQGLATRALVLAADLATLVKHRYAGKSKAPVSLPSTPTA